MKVAIHNRAGSFSDRWTDYCTENEIPFELIDCHRSDIVSFLRENKFTHLMWHINHSSYKDIMNFNSVLNAADQMNIKTFPDFNTRWHFDDKVAQKYLLESLGVPFVESEVFYDREEATRYVHTAQLPFVAKLKRGAGSLNVRLIHSTKEGEEYIRTMFKTGISPMSGTLQNLDQKIRIARQFTNLWNLFSKVKQSISKSIRNKRLASTEKGYVFFQKFLPNNAYDTRIIIIGNKAFGITRMNRKNDFRASGSGLVDYDPERINTRMIEIAFETSRKLNAQCLAYDFVYDGAEPKILEIGFGFSMLAYDTCDGYWDMDLRFNAGKFNPQEFMIRDFLNQKTG